MALRLHERMAIHICDGCAIRDNTHYMKQRAPPGDVVLSELLDVEQERERERERERDLGAHVRHE